MANTCEPPGRPVHRCWVAEEPVWPRSLGAILHVRYHGVSEAFIAWTYQSEFFLKCMRRDHRVAASTSVPKHLTLLMINLKHLTRRLPAPVTVTYLKGSLLMQPQCLGPVKFMPPCITNA